MTRATPEGCAPERGRKECGSWGGVLGVIGELGRALPHWSTIR